MLLYPDYRSSEVFSNLYLPVGLGYVARSLETADIEYEVVDLNIDSTESLIDRIGKFSPDFMGISMMSYRCQRTYDLLQNMKSAFPRVQLVAGGPHITANPEKVMMECPAIDIGVVGEGEAARRKVQDLSSERTVRDLLDYFAHIL